MTIELKLEEIIAVKDALETVIPALLEEGENEDAALLLLY